MGIFVSKDFVNSKAFVPPKESKVNGAVYYNKTQIFHINRKSKYCIIYSHGNATNLGEIIKFLKNFSEKFNISIISYEYKGYDKVSDENKPNDVKSNQDILNTVKYANKNGYPNEKIILYGASIGSGPSVYAASKHSFAGIILQSPFKSIIKTVVDINIFNWLLKSSDIFKNDELIVDISCPVFILHGEKDKLISIYHSKYLSEKSKNLYGFYMIDGAGHNDIIEKMGADYICKVKNFIKYVSK